MLANQSNDASESDASNDNVEGEEDNFITRDATFIEDFEECPNCAEGDNRWVYTCDECGFTGCYDGVFDNGCYVGDEDERACPDCGGKERTRTGRVGAGSSDEL